ncbi:efflux RND transporter periplasmic adaptor subunit [Algoriphagus boritolerans]|uniref:RND family efflux transporter, MFP subunit n=1 Tax=Algoriphagus boritolerans DSM 17298 = JCM 18970 TaxID=1120964 RepID=A0A1H5UDH7_9BACT|nr:efflux RND transporter periplasmic adaptor subunit [Algoriphagus boritolerans]SEF73094.1 RND family efflux transporter, MFP subunit [Algoriphagus boritolerans DSM 17298 = JCM 18970]
MRLIYMMTLFLLITACQSAEEQEAHSHEDGEEHSHEEGAVPALNFTIWTGQTELFVEFPALVVGQPSRFAAHFTVLDRHQPVREGSVTVNLIKGDKGIRSTADAPSSQGIFTPTLQPKEAGEYRLVFELKTPDYSDRIEVGNVQVFASVEDAVQGVPVAAENANAISFLKEQAWKMDFQTAPVMEKEILDIIPTSGVWKVAPSDYQTLIAPASGSVSFAKGMLTEGSPVRKGQVLMTVSGAGLTTGNLDTEIQKAKAEFEQAQSEYLRKKELFEAKIVPKAEFERVEQRYMIAKANFETLSSGYTGSGKQIISPIDGYIKSIQAQNGQFVNQGAALFSVTSHKSSLLEVRVSPAYFSQLQQLQDIFYQTSPNNWSSLKAKGGKVLSVGKEVEADQPLLSVFAEVNEGVEMPEGSFTEAQLAVGIPANGTAIPSAALLEDYGQYSVIVQLSGESFERRNIQVGKKNGSEVEVLNGLKPGEVVVTRGAYQVKMASMSGQAPAHGHAH